MTTQRKQQTLSGVDKSFLHLETEEHPMTVASMSIFHEDITVDEIKDSFKTLAERFSRFRQRVSDPVSSAKERYWEDYDFDIDLHVTEIVLPSASEASTGQDDQSHPELREIVSELMSTPLDYSMALWKCEIIRYQSDRTAMLVRVHHCVTDGQGGIRCLLDITNNAHNTELQYGKHTKPTQALLSSSWKQRALQALQLFILLLQLAWGAVLGLWHFFMTLVFFKRSHFKGQLTTDKMVSFTNDVDLNNVKTIKNHFNVSVNDVLIASLAGSFREYILKTDGAVKDKDLLTYIPFSMRKADDWELGNKVSVVMAKLPLNIEDPVERLMEVHKRMNTIKNSKEPIVTYYITEYLGNSRFADHPISQWVLRHLLSKPHAVFTNVPGPREHLQFCGKTIQSLTPFIPQPGEGGIGVSLLSYADKVACSLVADRDLLANGNEISSGLASHIEHLRQLVPVSQ
mmetsp:Transcript_15848/g.20164  ORF Transcript_15848/g.20164 Transcript_15848/m.20164 type:complete len:458 (-) Transcript_15848:21-1394(-)